LAKPQLRFEVFFVFYFHIFCLVWFGFSPIDSTKFGPWRRKCYFSTGLQNGLRAAWAELGRMSLRGCSTFYFQTKGLTGPRKETKSKVVKSFFFVVVVM